MKFPKVFYGWWVVGAGFLTMFMGVGMSSYSKGVFLNAMCSNLGWFRGDLSLAMSLGTIIGAITMPLVGAWIDRHGAGRLIAVSAFITGSLLVISSQIHALWQAFIIFSLLGITQTSFMNTPVIIMVSNWFVEKRGRATAITTAGMGAGGIFGPLSTYLIANLDWRLTWVVLGALVWLVVIPPALLIMKQKPELLGLLPDGKVSEDGELTSMAIKASANPTVGDRWTLKRILGTSIFWLMAAVSSLFFLGYISIQMHSFSLFTDRGVSDITAGTMVGIIGLVGIVGKLVLGHLSDKISARYVVIGALTLNVVAMSIILITDANSISWSFAVLFGFAGPGIVGVLSVLQASYFSRAMIGRILGIYAMCTGLSGLVGASFMGYSFDVTHSYNLGLLVCIAVFIVSALLTFFAAPPRDSALSHD